jgi:hypothetical protein
MPVRQQASYGGYYDCSVECWDVYTEVLGAEFSDAVLFGQVHQLTVDAYALQHAGGRHPDKSVAIHLTGLYLMLERGVRPTSVPPLFQELAAKVSDWPHFPPPEVDWSVTVWDVALAGASNEHADRSREWAAAVWRGWSIHHDAIARVVGAHLAIGALPISQR